MHQKTFTTVKIFFLLSLFFSSPLYSQDKTLPIYFFWGDGCPHCAHEKPFLEEMKIKYPNIEVKSFEIWKNSFNQHFYKRMAAAYKLSGGAVPTTIIGEKVFEGYADEYRPQIEKQIIKCLQNACIDPKSVLDHPELLNGQKTQDSKTIALPLIGTIDTTTMALPVFTLIIAALDSFNPCAFFVLFILLGMLIHARSRKRMLFIGLVFVFFSGLIYFLFMAAWFNLFNYIGNAVIITVITGIIALVIAGFNIKDFFFFKKGASLSIPEKAKPKLFDRMRKLLKADSLISMTAGTVVLAILANSYELLCTAGFPMIYTRVLTQHELSGFSYYLYLIFYNLIYIVPLTIIVIIFTVTLGSKKLSESQGENLKLVSGLMMLFLGAILLIYPALLNNIFTSILMILCVLGISFILIKIKNRKAGKRKK